MNARQKAKKYKRMYEALAKQPVMLRVEQPKQLKIDTLKFERYYPEELVVNESKDFLWKAILKDVAEGLANSLDRYIDYRTEFCSDLGFRLSEEIMVVRRED